MFDQSAITIRGMDANPAVAAMYEKLRNGYGIDGGLARIQQSGMGPGMRRHLTDAARIMAARGQTGYNMALSPLNAELSASALGADRASYLREMQATQAQQGAGMSYVMSLLAPFLSQVMSAA